jgi:hypothetical protein
MKAELVLLYVSDGGFLALLRVGEEAEELTVTFHLPAQVGHMLEPGRLDIIGEVTQRREHLAGGRGRLAQLLAQRQTQLAHAEQNFHPRKQ